MTMSGDDLVTFLRARLDEIEQAARAVKPLANVPVIGGPQRQEFTHGRLTFAAEDGYPKRLADQEAAAHFSRHDPARVLADVEAKRQVVELHDDQHDCPGNPPAYEFPYPGCATLRALALPYETHPDYREEWRPEATRRAAFRPTDHLALRDGTVACGANYPEMQSSADRHNVTCPDCLAAIERGDTPL
ncbi:MAG: DUF6221 family protein [Actinomycetota bacterium]|nr:DUF6221 family protein [Actinomycetota bacterium]